MKITTKTNKDDDIIYLLLESETKFEAKILKEILDYTNYPQVKT